MENQAAACEYQCGESDRNEEESASNFSVTWKCLNPNINVFLPLFTVISVLFTQFFLSAFTKKEEFLMHEGKW
jgi:hypothetical protein